MNVAREIVTALLIFDDIDQFNHTFSHAHIKTHTHKYTFMISARRNDESRVQEPDWESGRKAFG